MLQSTLQHADLPAAVFQGMVTGGRNGLIWPQAEHCATVSNHVVFPGQGLVIALVGML